MWIEWATAVSAEGIAAELEANAAALPTFRARDELRTERVRSYRPPKVFRPTVAGRARSAVHRLRGIAGLLRRRFR